MAKKVLTGYPQMPPLNAAELETFLAKALVARLGTLNEDGTIHMTPIYFIYEKGEFFLGTQVASRRVRNIKRNPHVTLLVDDVTGPYQAALIYGTAELLTEGVVDKREAIFAKYGNGDQSRAVAEAICDKWKSVLIHIKPERIVSFDYTKASLL